MKPEQSPISLHDDTKRQVESCLNNLISVATSLTKDIKTLDGCQRQQINAALNGAVHETAEQIITICVRAAHIAVNTIEP